MEEGLVNPHWLAITRTTNTNTNNYFVFTTAEKISESTNMYTCNKFSSVPKKCHRQLIIVFEKKEYLFECMLMEYSDKLLYDPATEKKGNSAVFYIVDQSI